MRTPNGNNLSIGRGRKPHVRRKRAMIGVLLLGTVVLGGYLAVPAQEAPWPPPPVRPPGPGTAHMIQQTSATATAQPAEDSPLLLEPEAAPKKPTETISTPGNTAPPPLVEVRELEGPAVNPLPSEGGPSPGGPPLDAGISRINEISGSPGLADVPPKHAEVKSAPASVHVAVPIRRHQSAPVAPPPEVLSNGDNAPELTSVPPVAKKVQAPLLTIEKRGPTSVKMGQPVHYEIVVHNVGLVAAQQVRVEDELPEMVRFLGGNPQPVYQGGRIVWNLEEVPAGGEQRLLLDLEPETSGEISGQTSLVLTIGSQTEVTAAPLEVSITGPGRVAKDGQAHFEIHLSNRGNRPLSNLILHAQLPAGLLHPMGKNIEAEVGEIAPGANRNIDLRVTAVQPGRHTFLARITAQDRQEGSARASVYVGEPGLIVLQPATTRIQLDRTGELTVEVANYHTRVIKNLSVTAALPEGVEFQSASEGGAYRAGLRKVQWVLENLAPEQSRTLTINVKGKVPGQFVNTVVAQAAEGLKAQVSGKVVVERLKAQVPGKVVVESMSNLTMKISHRDDPLEVGHETVYEIRVGNQGNTADSGVHIQATVPEGMSPRGADGPTAYRIQGQQVIFEPLAQLEPNSQVIYHVNVMAQAAGDRRFRVEMSSANRREPFSREDRTLVVRD
jgi:uncharacterized repeat protein (TIGR01451 family)